MTFIGMPHTENGTYTNTTHMLASSSRLRGIKHLTLVQNTQVHLSFLQYISSNGCGCPDFCFLLFVYLCFLFTFLLCHKTKTVFACCFAVTPWPYESYISLFHTITLQGEINISCCRACFPIQRYCSYIFVFIHVHVLAVFSISWRHLEC